MTRAKVGERRVYPGHTLPVLYPGEQAICEPVSVEQLLDAAVTGEPVSMGDWLVEPAPGLHAWVLRWRYRLIGQWTQALAGRWRRAVTALRSWWRRHRPVNAWQPGHSKLERMKALDDEMVWRKD